MRDRLRGTQRFGHIGGEEVMRCRERRSGKCLHLYASCFALAHQLADCTVRLAERGAFRTR